MNHTSETASHSTDNAELLLLKRRQAELLRLKAEALRHDGLPFYRPHPKQDLFHRSTAQRRGAFTGNRFGKSTMGCAEDCAWLRGERPWMSKDDPARRLGIPQRPVKGLIIANDWDKVAEIWTGKDGKIWNFLPRNGFIESTARNHSGTIDTIVCKSPFHGFSTLRFDTVRSWMSNPLGIESSDWDFIHVDEPCPEGMFKGAARGLIDRSGKAWFTLTAIAEPWITDAFDPDGIFWIKGNPPPFLVEGSIYDNTFLKTAAIAEYEATLTEDEKQCRLYGKPLHKAGLVYKEFQRDKHVLTTLPHGWTSWSEPPVDWTYYAYVDPHPHTPHMVILLAVDPFNRKYYFHDLFEKSLIRDLCAHVRAVLGPRRLTRVRLDPLAFTEDPVHGTTMADEFRRCGLAGEKASKDLSRGILRVQAELCSASHPFFTPSCRRTIWEFGRYHWDEETNKPVDKDDHAMECLYRSVLDEPSYVDPQNLRTVVDDIIISGHDYNLDPVFGKNELVLRQDDVDTLMLN